MRLYSMLRRPLPQLRLTAFQLATVLSIAIVGTSATLAAQKIDGSNSSTASTVETAKVIPVPATAVSYAELPDAPSGVLEAQQAAQQAVQQSGQTSSSTTPAPQATTTNPDAVSPNGTQQTKRILGIMPNFRSVSADIKLPPQTAKAKFIAAGKDTFDYSSFFIAGLTADDQSRRRQPQRQSPDQARPGPRAQLPHRLRRRQTPAHEPEGKVHHRR
jgi:hypothetical protein